MSAERVIPMLYPLKLDPVYKEPIWGGKRLREIFGKDIPSDTTGESWEIACHENGTSTVSNGVLKGKSLKEVIDEYGIEALGTKIGEEGKKKFPLLVKIIDASDKLSVQVHPEDEYAKEHEGELGKTEMWIVLDAKPGAQLVYGLKPGVSQEMFEEGIQKGTLENLLNFVDVQKGDVFFIPAGTLHAIGEGLLIAEIQQNSDTTYRVYDWNRVDGNGNSRELHIQKALDVTNLSHCSGQEKVKGTIIKEGENTRNHLVSCKYFITEILEVQKESKETLNGERFDLLMAIEGNGAIQYREGTVPFNAGDSFFIPAGMGDYSILGPCKIIKTYVPVS